MAVLAHTLPGVVALPAKNAVALMLVLLGGVAAVAGVLAFGRHHTTVNPLRPDQSSTLVASGVYRLSRNPMYLGFLLVLAGWAVYLASVAAALMLPAFVIYMNRFQIAPEERALATLFGPEFETYKATTRRWL
ncbi:methyltransferase family protein [Roseateles sp. BYS180W]|uniref:Methyltransferase family protein n=1 Tax=Roseateles rivi TaxID=3299028 RepID=A0ABW7FUD3_9BURK